MGRAVLREVQLKMHQATPPEILQGFWQQRREVNPSYSLRSLARDAGVSPSFLSLFLAGKRNLSEEKALEISKKLKWPKPRSLAFARACLLTRGRCVRAVREQIVAVIGEKTSGRARFSHRLEASAFSIIADWFHGAILQLTEVKCFRIDPNWIGRRLGISARTAEEAIRRLVELQLLKRDGDTWSRIEGDVEVPSVPSSAIQRFHWSMLMKATEALRSDPPSTRDFTGTFIPIDKAMLPQVRLKIRALQKEILEMSETSQEKDSLYFLSTAYYRVDRTIHEKRDEKDISVRQR